MNLHTAIVRSFDSVSRTATVVIPNLYGTVLVRCTPFFRRNGDGPVLTSTLLSGDRVLVSVTENDAPQWIDYMTVSEVGGDFLSTSGGELTGPLTLSGPPTNSLHATTKAYVDTSVIPDVHEVNSQSAMLALPATAGDYAIRLDVSKYFILKQAPASTLSNWVELVSGNVAAAMDAHIAAADPHTQYMTDAEFASALATHEGAPDPHSIYLTQSEADPRYTNASNIVSGTLAKERLPSTIDAITTGTASAWTSARLLSLAGDLSGSVLIKGDAAMSLTAAVVDDSHSHDARYYTEAESDALFYTRAFIDLTFYTKVDSDARYYTQVDADARYYTQTDSDARFFNVTGDVISSGALGFGNRLGQHLNLWSTTHGLGVQSDTVYQRTPDGFAWYMGGAHNDAAYDPGGGTELLRMSDIEFRYKGDTLWHQGNDGAGSGLDADLLDGEDSAAFARQEIIESLLGDLLFVGLYDADSYLNEGYVEFPGTASNMLSWPNGTPPVDASADWRVDFERMPIPGAGVNHDVLGFPFFVRVQETHLQMIMAADDGTFPFAQETWANLEADPNFPAVGERLHMSGTWDPVTDTISMWWRPQDRDLADDSDWVLGASEVAAGKQGPNPDPTAFVGSTDAAFAMTGRWYRALTYLNGALVHDINPTLDLGADPEATEFTATTGQTVTVLRSGTPSTTLGSPRATRPKPTWAGGPTVYRHAMYWVVNSAGELNFIDDDLSGRYEVGVDQGVGVSFGDWIIAIDPDIATNGPGVDLPQSDITFQYIPFSAETYVKSEISRHMDPDESPDPHSQYLNEVRGDDRYAPVTHDHVADFEQAVINHQALLPHMVTDWMWVDGKVTITVTAAHTMLPGGYADLAGVHAELDGKWLIIEVSDTTIVFEAPQPSDYPTPGTPISVNGTVTNDPHAQYLTEVEGDFRFAQLEHEHAYEPLGVMEAHLVGADPHTQYLTHNEGDNSYATLLHLHDDRYSQIGHIHPIIEELHSTDGATSAELWIGGVEPVEADGLEIGDLWVETLVIPGQVPSAAQNMEVNSSSGTTADVTHWLWPETAAILQKQIDRSPDGVSGWVSALDSGDPPLFDPATHWFHREPFLTENTTYYFRLRARNSIGWGPYVIRSVTTINDPPAAPTDVVATSLSPTTIRLSWTAVADLHATEAYQIFVNGESQGFFTKTPGTATEDFAGKQENTTYTIEIQAKDVQGASSSVVGDSTTTLNAPPPAPTGLVLSGGAFDRVTLSWDAVTGISDFKDYQLMLDGAHRAFVTTTSYTFTGLTELTAYEFQVRTRDTSLAVSSTSTGNWTTPANPDTTPPPVPALTSFMPEASYGRMVSRFTIASTGGTTQYRVLRNLNDGSWVQDLGWTNCSQGQGIARVLGPMYSAGHKVGCRIEVRDAAFNVAAVHHNTYLLKATPTEIHIDATQHHVNGQFNYYGDRRPRQGFDSSSAYDAVGMWIYGTKIQDQLHYGGRRTIVGCNMWLERSSVDTPSTAVDVRVRMHNFTVQPATGPGNAPVEFGAHTTIGNLRPGVGEWFALPAAFIQDLVDGTHRGILCRRSTTPSIRLFNGAESSSAGKLSFNHLG